MIQFIASQPVEIIWEIDHAKLSVERRRVEKGTQTPANNQETVKLTEFVARLKTFCEHLGLEAATDRLLLFEEKLKAADLPFYYPAINSELDGIKYAIEAELKKRKC